MAHEIAAAFVQALRWIAAGLAGAAFSKFNLLDANTLHLIGFLVPLIFMLAFVEYLLMKIETA